MINPKLKLKVVKINDAYGPATKDNSIDCIVCSMESSQACESINKLRSDIGFEPLEIFEIGFVSENDCSFETKLSSSHIREVISNAENS